MARKDVVLAKLSRPRIHDALVRTRLHDVLADACRKPVVWQIGRASCRERV